MRLRRNAVLRRVPRTVRRIVWPIVGVLSLILGVLLFATPFPLGLPLILLGVSLVKPRVIRALR